VLLSDICERIERSVTIERLILDEHTGVIYTVLDDLKSNNSMSNLTLLICVFSLIILMFSMEIGLLLL
jgi:hypothetical protein